MFEMSIEWETKSRWSLLAYGVTNSLSEFLSHTDNFIFIEKYNTYNIF